MTKEDCKQIASGIIDFIVTEFPNASCYDVMIATEAISKSCLNQLLESNQRPKG